jgi:hypothetical protein
MDQSAIKSILLTVLEGDENEEWIGVDFDGTLAEYGGWHGATKCGKPIPKMVARVRRWVGHGKKVKIFTARADDEKSVNAIKKWLKDNELPDLEITNIKDQYMVKLWDDKAVGVETNTGEVKESIFGRARDYFSPEPEDHYRAVVDEWFNNLSPWIFNQARDYAKQATTPEEVEGALAEYVTVKGGLQTLFKNWSGYSRRLAAEYAVNKVLKELRTWENLAEGCYLLESPEIKTLKKNQCPLDPEERAQVMKAGAVWHMGKDGAASPAVRKAVVNGKTWYWCATHRAGQVRSTLKAAIKSFDFIKTTA